MSPKIQSQSESSKHIQVYDVPTITESVGVCQFYNYQDYIPKEKEPPKGYISLGSLVKRWESTESGRSALEDGRRWVSDSFYSVEAETIKALRLKKGWSQAALAKELSTSQPHVARIERGTENIGIETCRKICRALDIDMNMLDKALKAQEAIFKGRQSV